MAEPRRPDDRLTREPPRRPSLITEPPDRHWPEPPVRLRAELTGAELFVHLVSLAIVVCCYGASFFMPAYHFWKEPHYGWECFQISAHPGIWFWDANPVFWVGCFFLARGWGWPAASMGVVALALGGYILQDPRGLLIGYYAWLGSFALLMVAGLVRVTFRLKPR